MQTTLERRVTHKYRDGWRNLDEWETLGAVTVRRRFGEQLKDDADIDDEAGTVLLVEVELALDGEYTEDDVRRALNSTFSGSDCTHDYDCCGCVSRYARAQAMGGKEWMLLINYTRNY